VTGAVVTADVLDGAVGATALVSGALDAGALDAGAVVTAASVEEVASRYRSRASSTDSGVEEPRSSRW
jgi:hypothetical protein